MNGKRSKTVRKAISRLFKSSPGQFPVGYKMKNNQIFSVRRIMYKRIKKLVNVERMDRAEIGGLFI